MIYPEAIQNIIEALRQLPAVGPKTAERYALFLSKQSPDFLNRLALNLQILPTSIRYCSLCRSLTVDDPCAICADPNRDRSQLCIVAETKDLLIIENSRSYRGLYLVLGGTLSAINSQGPANLHLEALNQRLKTEPINEVILALNPDLDGETTCLYLQKFLTPFRVKVSRLAKGLPSGASLDYADQLTIVNALKFRNNI